MSPETTTNALDRDWLALRQWARLTLSCAIEHATTSPEAHALLAQLHAPLTDLIALCEDQDRPLEARVRQLEADLTAHVAEDARG
jgi:hypothetical protein